MLFCKMISLFLINVFSLVLADAASHNLGKRQIGVLARTGALPQGKRSVEVLARNGELPHSGGKKDLTNEELLLEELERAEALAEEVLGAEKRSVAALARNGELPQKRLSEVLTRSGYLIRPPQETVQHPSDLLDPDDFLVDGQWWRLYPERTFLTTHKRSLGSARNFLSDYGINLYNKKNLASLARGGELESFSRSLAKDRKIDVGKRNVDDLSGRCPSMIELEYGRKKREQITADSDYEDSWTGDDSKGDAIDKRFLGRIPQLGRIHQKVQTPSARRRPHLRPNWL